MTLAEFITARLGELETSADELHRVEYCRSVGCPDYEFTPEDCDCGVPGRVLRQVTAIRAILAEHQPVPMRGIKASSCWPCRLPYPCPTIRAVPAIWSDHPDYGKWKP